jgi:hypothetical protein
MQQKFLIGGTVRQRVLPHLHLPVSVAAALLRRVRGRVAPSVARAAQ